MEQVLELIVCPACHGHLAIDREAIACQRCRRRYPVQDGIPVLLINRATAPSPSK